MSTPEHDVFDDVRRGDLYRFLSSREGWISMYDLAYHMRGYYPIFGWVTNFHNSYIRRKITADIKAINADPEYPMIIISSRRGVKIATRDEYEHWIKAELRETFEKLKGLRKIMKKSNLDGQYDLFEQEYAKVFQEGS